MKAAVYTKARLGKVLEMKDLEQPVPKDNEVVIRVRAASVNPLDWRMKSQRPGVDVAGEVAAVGGTVTQFKPGDAVFGVCKGRCYIYAVTAKREIIPKVADAFARFAKGWNIRCSLHLTPYTAPQIFIAAFLKAWATGA